MEDRCLSSVQVTIYTPLLGSSLAIKEQESLRRVTPGSLRIDDEVSDDYLHQHVVPLDVLYEVPCELRQEPATPCFC